MVRAFRFVAMGAPLQSVPNADIGCNAAFLQDGLNTAVRGTLPERLQKSLSGLLGQAADFIAPCCQVRRDLAQKRATCLYLLDHRQDSLIVGRRTRRGRRCAVPTRAQTMSRGACRADPGSRGFFELDEAGSSTWLRSSGTRAQGMMSFEGGDFQKLRRPFTNWFCLRISISIKYSHNR
ncbi:MAG: hypothetical protein AAF484_14890 [Pseudomonadota bacterium]